MIDKNLIEIIQLCLDIDKKAFKIYCQLSELFENNLKKFWNKMAGEENEHVAYWQRILHLAQQGLVPQVFNDPDTVKGELEKICEKVEKILENNRNSIDIPTSFLIAYRLEFYVLHPVFATLFHVTKIIEDGKNPEDDYEKHINEFIDALNQYGNVTPELELLGETLQRLWHENKILALQSSVDELTGVFNRRGFLNILKTLSHLAQRNSFHIGIMMVDIDQFKKVNDTYGHKKGDDVLKKIATLLKSSLRTSDIIGRYGGEEFIVFLSSITPESVYELAEKIRRKVEQEASSGIAVTISIGVAHGILKEKVEREILDLISKADACLYEAKMMGRNKVVVCDS